MTLSSFSWAMKIFGITPVLLVGVMTLLYWRVLVRRWQFALVGSLTLYAFALIPYMWVNIDVGIYGPATGPGLTGIHVEAIGGMSLPARMAVAFVSLIVLGGAFLWHLKRRFERP